MPHRMAFLKSVETQHGKVKQRGEEDDEHDPSPDLVPRAPALHTDRVTASMQGDRARACNHAPIEAGTASAHALNLHERRGTTTVKRRFPQCQQRE
eukprot:246364-Rhodomonas_salina.1